MKQPVLRVDEIQLGWDGNVLLVRALGTASTPGWRDPELRLVADNGTTLVYEFVAIPPDTQPQVLTPIEAATRTGPIEPPFPIEVVVRAATNELRRPIPPDSTKERIYDVTEAYAQLAGNEITVHAKGRTRTSGWTDPELVQLSLDDELVVEFIARDNGGALQVLTPIEVQQTFGPLRPPFPTHVIVVAETNRIRTPVLPTPYATPPSGSEARV